MWPAAMASLGIELSGRMAPAEQAEPGRAIARLTDLGWGNQLRDLFAATTVDDELPNPLRHALVQVLETWDYGPDGGPDAIVGIDSRARPVLTRHLAAGLSRFTGWPEVARFVIADGASDQLRHDVNSAHRLAAVLERLSAGPPASRRGQAGAPPRRPVRLRLDARGHRPAAAPRRSSCGLPPCAGDHHLVGNDVRSTSSQRRPPTRSR